MFTISKNIVYYERRRILESLSLRRTIFSYGEQVITELFLELKNEPDFKEKIITLVENLFARNLMITQLKDKDVFKSLISEFDLYELKLYLFEEFWITYLLKITELSVYGDEVIENLERSIILLNTDRIWREHLQRMTLLRETVGWRGYGQRNPLSEYKVDAFNLFTTAEKLRRHTIIYDLLRLSIL